MKNRTTINISTKLRDALKEKAKKSETYEDLLWRLIK